MAKTTYLFRRKNVFYFRFRVPAQHQNLFKTREIVQSLRTESREEATYRALRLAAHINSLLHDIKAGKAREISSIDSLTSLSARDNEQNTFKPIKAVITPGQSH